MNFQSVDIYSHRAFDVNKVATKIKEIFPRCNVNIRKPFRYNDRIEYARISDLKQPYEKQPKHTDASMILLYDGFMLQRIFEQMISADEMDRVHLVITDLLPCTFSEEDWRYHGRALVCGTPSIISTTGIIEAPARPREFYLTQLGAISDLKQIKKKFAGRFLDYGDSRMTSVVSIYALQALFFFVSDGEPFCSDSRCLLYNAHWQEELVCLLEKGSLCASHKKMANKFNKLTIRR